MAFVKHTSYLPEQVLDLTPRTEIDVSRQQGETGMGHCYIDRFPVAGENCVRTFDAQSVPRILQSGSHPSTRRHVDTNVSDENIGRQCSHSLRHGTNTADAHDVDTLVDGGPVAQQLQSCHLSGHIWMEKIQYAHLARGSCCGAQVLGGESGEQDTETCQGILTERGESFAVHGLFRRSIQGELNSLGGWMPARRESVRGSDCR